MVRAVSGLFGSKETAQIEVSVGMGLVAGSTVMALTVLWGSCIVAGKCDIVGSATKDSQDTKTFSLTGNLIIKLVFIYLYLIFYKLI